MQFMSKGSLIVYRNNKANNEYRDAFRIPKNCYLKKTVKFAS